jgi:hypothetical protein
VPVGDSNTPTCFRLRVVYSLPMSSVWIGYGVYGCGKGERGCKSDAAVLARGDGVEDVDAILRGCTRAGRKRCAREESVLCYLCVSRAMSATAWVKCSDAERRGGGSSLLPLLVLLLASRDCGHSTSHGAHTSTSPSSSPPPTDGLGDVRRDCVRRRGERHVGH